MEGSFSDDVTLIISVILAPFFLQSYTTVHLCRALDEGFFIFSSGYPLCVKKQRTHIYCHFKSFIGIRRNIGTTYRDTFVRINFYFLFKVEINPTQSLFNS